VLAFLKLRNLTPDEALTAGRHWGY